MYTNAEAVFFGGLQEKSITATMTFSVHFQQTDDRTLDASAGCAGSNSCFREQQHRQQKRFLRRTVRQFFLLLLLSPLSQMDFVFADECVELPAYSKYMGNAVLSCDGSIPQRAALAAAKTAAPTAPNDAVAAVAMPTVEAAGFATKASAAAAASDAGPDIPASLLKRNTTVQLQQTKRATTTAVKTISTKSPDAITVPTSNSIIDNRARGAEAATHAFSSRLQATGSQPYTPAAEVEANQEFFLYPPPETKSAEDTPVEIFPLLAALPATLLYPAATGGMQSQTSMSLPTRLCSSSPDNRSCNKKSASNKSRASSSRSNALNSSIPLARPTTRGGSIFTKEHESNGPSRSKINYSSNRKTYSGIPGPADFYITQRNTGDTRQSLEGSAEPQADDIKQSIDLNSMSSRAVANKQTHLCGKAIGTMQKSTNNSLKRVKIRGSRGTPCESIRSAIDGGSDSTRAANGNTLDTSGSSGSIKTKAINTTNDHDEFHVLETKNRWNIQHLPATNTNTHPVYLALSQDASLVVQRNENSRTSTVKADERKTIADGEMESALLWMRWRIICFSVMSVALVVLAGVASGLTIGLMAFDELQLLVLQESGAQRERNQAESVCRLMQGNRHQLLVTLLLCNALAMEALPLFLDRIMSSVLAVLLSVTAILFVGEILPQALCTGKYQLAIAATLAPFVRLLLYLFAPIAYPISRLLDRWLSTGGRPNLYARAHLKALIGLHEKDRHRPLLLQQKMEHRCEQQRLMETLSGDGEEGGPTSQKHKGILFELWHNRTTCARSMEGNAASKLHAESIAPATGPKQQPHSAAALSKNCNAAGPCAETVQAIDAAGSGEQNAPDAAKTLDYPVICGGAQHQQQQDTLECFRSSSVRRRLSHGTEWRKELESDIGLNRDEVLIMQGALDMACKSVCDLLVPLNDVFMLESSVRLTREILIDILLKGHSRIPIFETHRHNVRGVLLMKSLVLIDPAAGVKVSDLMRGRSFRRLCTPLFVDPTINPYQLLNEFQEGRCHLAFVTRHVAAYQQAWEENTPVPAGAQLLGIVTLEDVIEELIQEEIMDEFDQRRSGIALSALRGFDGHWSSIRAREAAAGVINAHENLVDASTLPNSEQQRQQLSSKQSLAKSASEDPTHMGLYGSFAKNGVGATSNRTEPISRFASLLLNKNAKATASKGGSISQERSATSILAASQLGSRTSLLFAGEPEIDNSAFEACLSTDTAPGILCQQLQKQHSMLNGKAVKNFCPSRSPETGLAYRPASADGVGRSDTASAAAEKSSSFAKASARSASKAEVPFAPRLSRRCFDMSSVAPVEFILHRPSTSAAIKKSSADQQGKDASIERSDNVDGASLTAATRGNLSSIRLTKNDDS